MAQAARLKRTALTAAAVALAIFLSWVGYEIVNAGSDVPPPQPQALTQLEGGRAAGKRIDGRSWSFDYASATMTADGQEADLNGVRDGIIRRDGKPYLRMRAQHVSANMGANDFTATGPVVLTEIGGQHRKLETVGAHFSGVNRSLVLDHTTKVSEGSITVVVDHASIDFATGETRLGRMIGTM